MAPSSVSARYLTVAWNTLEGVVAIAAGVAAGSVSLVAFGLDSSVEVFASLVVIWELRGIDRGRERRALRLIEVGYLAVAVYVAWDASRALMTWQPSSGLGAGDAVLRNYRRGDGGAQGRQTSRRTPPR